MLIYTAQLHIPNPKLDRDAMIAASAITHGMTLVTRNIIDFKDMSVALINPWDE
ncbi:plasmid stabilization protein [Cysteiniphilum marinum]|uniref:plasmid stabilization protein n=1 Tax=Cysteiniphilum marinum TaxID=2774191 RepID=UPI001F3E8C8C|nr:plasmid stabilization protein [Cysteiniphilum marinum]